MRKLISQERDPDASQAIREAVMEMDRIEVAMETVSAVKFDLCMQFCKICDFHVDQSPALHCRVLLFPPLRLICTPSNMFSYL